MATTMKKGGYRPTESKYKGGATEMYVTYDLKQQTRAGNSVSYPKVKRVYIAGDVTDCKVGDFRKKSGRTAHGMRIEYDQTRRGYRREGFRATRGKTRYGASPASVQPTRQHFAQVVEVPERASNVAFHASGLPARYKSALRNVR